MQLAKTRIHGAGLFLLQLRHAPWNFRVPRPGGGHGGEGPAAGPGRVLRGDSVAVVMQDYDESRVGAGRTSINN